jgi:uncharacterized membrane protein (DUF106 family)
MKSMTDAQLYLAIGLPILAVLTSLTVSLVQISNVRGDVESLRGDMRELRKEFGDLRKDVDASLKEMRREAREDRLQIAADIKLLTGKVYELMAQK